MIIVSNTTQMAILKSTKLKLEIEKYDNDKEKQNVNKTGFKHIKNNN